MMNKKIFALLCTGAVFALSCSIHAAESGGKNFMALVGKQEKAKTFTNKTFIGKRFSGTSDKVNEKSSGAAIRADRESELVVTGCTFRDNGSSTWGTWGGAIAGSEKTAMTITNSTFVNNKAHHGGALSLVGDEQKLTLKDVSFNDNHALTTSGSVGGAILLQGAGIKLVYQVSAGKSIVNSGNTAVYGGFLHTHADITEFRESRLLCEPAPVFLIEKRDQIQDDDRDQSRDDRRGIIQTEDLGGVDPRAARRDAQVFQNQH